MPLFRYARSPYGQQVLVGAAWDWFGWVVGATLALIVVHAVLKAVLGPSAAPPPGAETGRVVRHLGVDRLYHWTMAASMLALIATGFLPIVGIKFAWVTPHWIVGVALSALVAHHVVRASIWQDFRAMLIAGRDIAEAWAAARRAWVRRGPPPARPGKYGFLQKAYHWTIAALVLALIATGLLMLLKIDTPLWRRDPYWFSDATWGVIYVVHGYAGMASVALVMVHIYLGLRPEKLWITRSMIRGWITRSEYRAHHDPDRWPAGEAATEAQAEARARLSAAR